jgi:hypothetical protein
MWWNMNLRIFFILRSIIDVCILRVVGSDVHIHRFSALHRFRGMDLMTDQPAVNSSRSEPGDLVRGVVWSRENSRSFFRFAWRSRLKYSVQIASLVSHPSPLFITWEWNNFLADVQQFRRKRPLHPQLHSRSLVQCKELTIIVNRESVVLSLRDAFLLSAKDCELMRSEANCHSFQFWRGRCAVA